MHVAQTRAALAAYEDRAVASHHSALVLRGVPAFSADLRQVHLTRTRGHLVPTPPRPDASSDGSGCRRDDGVIDLAVAVAQAGCVNGAMAALVAADAALHRELLTQADLFRAM